jgi:hypothetical protein
MPTWAVVLLAVAAAWIGVMLCLRALSLRLRERARQAMRRLLTEEPLLLDDARLLATEPPDLLPPAPHPMGVLALTPWRLHFLPWAARAPLMVPRAKVVSATVAREFAGASLPAPALVVEFRVEEGGNAKACWLVKDVEGWKEKLAG